MVYMHWSKETSLIAFKELFNSFQSVRIYVTSTLEQKNSNLDLISEPLEPMCCCAQRTDRNSLHCLQFWYRDCALNNFKGNELKRCKPFSLEAKMAKRMGRLKDRFFSKLRRPFHYKRVHKNKDEIEESVINSSEWAQTHSETTGKGAVTSNYLETDHNHCNSNSKSPYFKKGVFSAEETGVENLKVHRKTAEADEEEELVTQARQLPSQTRRRSSTFQKLINWVKPENRRHAICEQMEREIETRGVSLRQYRKFLATTYILYDLKMLWLTKDMTIHKYKERVRTLIVWLERCIKKADRNIAPKCNAHI